MNKTLCAGLVAFGIAVSAFAEEKAAQVYDLTVTVKTTTAKKATLSPKSNKFIANSESVIYRTQATQKWKGLIWGCDCNTLMGKWEVVNEKANFV